VCFGFVPFVWGFSCVFQELCAIYEYDIQQKLPPLNEMKRDELVYPNDDAGLANVANVMLSVSFAFFSLL